MVVMLLGPPYFGGPKQGLSLARCGCRVCAVRALLSSRLVLADAMHHEEFDGFRTCRSWAHVTLAFTRSQWKSMGSWPADPGPT